MLTSSLQNKEISMYDNLQIQNDLIILKIILLVILYIIIFYLAEEYILNRENHNSMYLYIFLQLCGGVWQIMSNNIFFTFVTIEFLTFVFYLQISRYSNALRYLILSSFLTTFLLLSFLLIYSQEGHLSYFQNIPKTSELFLIFFIIFKLGLFPFHSLTGDLYDSLPLGPMILCQLPVKYIYVVGLIPYIDFHQSYSIFMLIPALFLLSFNNFKRFIALSSLPYLTIILYVKDIYVIMFFLIIYLISILLQIFNKNPYILSFILLSLSGIPPFIGFFTKLYIIEEISNSILVFLFLFTTIILTACYLTYILKGIRVFQLNLKNNFLLALINTLFIFVSFIL